MMRPLTVAAAVVLLFSATYADGQTSRRTKRTAVKAKSTSTSATISSAAKSLFGSGSSAASLTNADYSNGLKEALKIATAKSAESASMLDGFNKNMDIRIPFPKDAIAVKEYAVKLGLQSQVEVFEEKLNRAAEEAAKKAAPIFLAAVVKMTIADAAKIVTGEKNAATQYLRSTSGVELGNQFKPVVTDALSQVAITKYWKPLVDKYNKVAPFLGKEKVQADLEQYVTDKAVDGLFVLVEKEEAKIRVEPMKYGSDLIKKIFGTTK